jgi:arsenate reductase
VLFVCTHNAGRSALAAALARARGGDTIRVLSAGTDPDTEPSATTIASLAEIGIDDASHRPQRVTAELVASADVVVAMKPGLDLPRVDGVRYETWSLPDPAHWDVHGIRPPREHIAAQVAALVDDLAGLPADEAEAGVAKAPRMKVQCGAARWPGRRPPRRSGVASMTVRSRRRRDARP